MFHASGAFQREIMATPAIGLAQVAKECAGEGLTSVNAQRLAKELAKSFSVQIDEVGILRLEKQQLVFVYPAKLAGVGTIPLNTAGSVAARTATSKRPELINNFAQTRHATIFEAVELDSARFTPLTGEKRFVIQKLMSAPVVGPAGVLGVIQISRKGISAAKAGPDFTPSDLQRLVSAAASLASCFK